MECQRLRRLVAAGRGAVSPQTAALRPGFESRLSHRTRALAVGLRSSRFLLGGLLRPRQQRAVLRPPEFRSHERVGGYPESDAGAAIELPRRPAASGPMAGGDEQ